MEWHTQLQPKSQINPEALLPGKSCFPMQHSGPGNNKTQGQLSQPTMLRKFPVPRVAESFTVKNQHRKSILKEAEWHFHLEGEDQPAASAGSCNCQPADRTPQFASCSTRRALWISAHASYSCSLGWEHAPYRASWEMLFLARTTEVHIVFCSLILWLWAWDIVIYTEREWGSTQYYFIDNKMMHLQYSAFGGKAQWRCTLSVYRTWHWGMCCQRQRSFEGTPRCNFTNEGRSLRGTDSSHRGVLDSKLCR